GGVCHQPEPCGRDLCGEEIVCESGRFSGATAGDSPECSGDGPSFGRVGHPGRSTHGGNHYAAEQ
ncbi:MAG TPA: hypothetical protein VMT57_01650, partial [Candidatus Thermoplasmatota archaeon]|nr:hypothetical protein [Candidatus Thermoplasmatota archaeon]